MSSRKRVLVLDDDDDSRRMLAMLLGHARFEVVSYDRCAAAEGHLSADVDIALLDVRMPERCGDDFGRELRERCPKTMIVFITAEPLIEPLKAAVPDCFVLRKPIDPAVLLELLNCFTSGREYQWPRGKHTDDWARPGNM